MRRRPFLKSIAAGLAVLPFIPRKVSSAVFLSTSQSPSPPPEDDWQLSSGHYTPAKIGWPVTAYSSQVAADTEGLVIFPRPDSETSSTSRQRWAHGSFDYEIPILVRGGAFPYHMEIDTDNTDSEITGGISIGANHDSANSWVVTITAATIVALTSGAKDVYVKVTDQEANELKVWWSLTKEVSELDHFFFVDKTNTGTKDGKYATPFSDIEQPGWLAGADGANSDNMILVIKEGDSQSSPYSKGIAGWVVRSTQHPQAVINIPGETPKIDSESTCRFIAFEHTDIFMRGLEVLNGRLPSSDGHGAFVSNFNNNDSQRCTITDCIFDTVVAWASSGINAGCITTDGNSSGLDREYFAVVGCTFANTAGRPSGINVGMCIGMMGWKYTLIDDISCSEIGNLSGTNGVSSIVYLKHAVTDVTVRRITAYDNCDFERGGIYSDDTTSSNSYDMANVEIHHNNMKPMDGSAEGVRVPGTIGASADGDFFIHRNTLNDSNVVLAGDMSAGVSAEVLNNASDEAHTLTCTCSVTNTSNYTDASFNADQTLTDAYLTTKGLSRGEVGHEIA